MGKTTLMYKIRNRLSGHEKKKSFWGRVKQNINLLESDEIKNESLEVVFSRAAALIQTNPRQRPAPSHCQRQREGIRSRVCPGKRWRKFRVRAFQHPRTIQSVGWRYGC